jgi:hypothetical protein
VRLVALLLFSLAVFAQAPPQFPSGAPPARARQKSAGALSPSAPHPPAALDEGTVSDHIYTSDYFRFRYRFPEEMDVKEDLMAGPQDESRRSFVLFAARGSTGGAGSTTLLIFADRAGLTPTREPIAYVAKVTAEMMQRQGFSLQAPIKSLTVGGQVFARADFAKQERAQTVLVTMRRGYAINFVLMAPSRAQANELVASLRTLEFLPLTAPPSGTAKPFGAP